VVRAGTSKSELQNKSAGCGAAEAYASGPGSEEEEEEGLISRVYDYIS
jgi:hypothetical protein